MPILGSRDPPHSSITTCVTLGCHVPLAPVFSPDLGRWGGGGVVLKEWAQRGQGDKTSSLQGW